MYILRGLFPLDLKYCLPKLRRGTGSTAHSTTAMNSIHPGAQFHQYGLANLITRMQVCRLDGFRLTD